MKVSLIGFVLLALLSTAEAGAEWTHLNPRPVASNLCGVHGTSMDNVFAASDDGGILAWNGAAWPQLPCPSGGSLYDVRAVGLDDVFAAGGGGRICHWDGTDWMEWTLQPSVYFKTLWSAGPDHLMGTAMCSPWARQAASSAGPDRIGRISESGPGSV